MHLLGKRKLFIKSEVFYSVFQWLFTNIFSALLGCLFGLSITKSKTIILGFTLIFIFSISIAIIQSHITRSYDIEKQIKLNVKTGDWKEIVRIAYPLSESLWYSGKYELRVRIAEYTNKACINLLSLNIASIKLNGRYTSIRYIRCAALIDDMGWTLFRVSKKYSNEAIKNILNGINIAESKSYYDLILKGYKHLFCITVELDKNFANTQVYSEKIRDVLSEKSYQQLNKQKRNFIEAGLYYSLAASCLTTAKQFKTPDITQKNLLRQANIYLDKAIQYYKKSDIDRYIKTFSVKAEILLYLDFEKYMPTIDELVNEGIILSQLHQERDRHFRLIILRTEVLLFKIKNTKNISELELLILELEKTHSETKKELKTSPVYYKQYMKLYNKIKRAKKNAFQII